MKVYGILGLFCLFACSSLESFAQRKRPVDPPIGTVSVKKDPLIDILQQFRAGSLDRSGSNTTEHSNRDTDRSHLTKTTVRGFRVQIFLGPSRSAAYAEQARFQQLFKEIDTYIMYEEPNYRVKVGDFRSRAEAERLAQGLRGQFSNVFIFTEDIFVYQ